MVKWIVLAAQTWEIEHVWILCAMELPNLIIGAKGQAEIDGFWNLLASQPHQNTELQFHKDPDNSGIMLEKKTEQEIHIFLWDPHMNIQVHIQTHPSAHI